MKEDGEKLKQRLPARKAELELIVQNAGNRLAKLKPLMSRRTDLLTRQVEAARHLLDLRLAIAWTRERLAQLRQVASPQADTGRPGVMREADGVAESIDMGGLGRVGRLAVGGSKAGARLMGVQQQRRALKSYELEVENRSPRIRHLCERKFFQLQTEGLRVRRANFSSRFTSSTSDKF
ncbi:unnamed protein product [Protopolystoma xenopodis]|uniref:Uncharacterized protein n=1 Tax=Protopolystoma xenopodis TaxID=117903 RepID=A0A448WCT9_9PLAT|nr:unnamed protein product [Protopolystoma xenopodis]